MDRSLKPKAELLGRLATARGIAWEADARNLPPDDDVARVGLLADRLGLSLGNALDPLLGEADYLALLGQGGQHG
ncbi:MAG TPA: hypothetical protein PKC60_11445 [Hydrogenophaga sp.]|uniref:hypothetical protein n=1 Tax=Hydrogenophaga sp. TaxID=1904254 RepID=UPI002C688A70|nr:hypothetical protein [Hydrogenophaga sp.]HMN93832.1 hypothetical protein [Hydrogenophaga sp.]HMP11280.1 hypothetical protein [Hydrogenophaga sp.]